MRKYAHDLQDECLSLAKLSAGDMIVLEVKYHPKCLAYLTIASMAKHLVLTGLYTVSGNN